LGILFATSATISLAALTTSSTLASDELHVLTDDAESLALLAGCLIVPLVKLQTALDEDGTSFGEILSGEFGLTSPKGDIDVGHFFDSLSVVPGANAVHGHAEVTNRCSLRSITDFKIPGDIPEEHDFVNVGHREKEWRLRV